MSGGQMLRVIGLMSGTSLDGVDAAVLITDGRRVAAFGPSLTIPYSAAERETLRAALGDEDAAAVAAAEAVLEARHVEAVESLRALDPQAPVDLVGFHGQTILHRPQARLTRQIGDGARLAKILGAPVAWDFRSADVAAGGQGAPLVPLYHQALAAGLAEERGSVAVVNIGGVANVTLLSDDPPIAFDTGPGNALLDDWMLRRTGTPCDRDGAAAAAGRIDAARLAELLDHPYFAAPPPKSLDRDDFAHRAARICDGLSLTDGAATLAAFTVGSILRAAEWAPKPVRRWLVCGGGRHNPTLMRLLAAQAGAAQVAPVEDEGWDGDALEAQAFAFLAARSLLGLPLTLPSTTGAPAPMTGGRVSRG